MSGFVDASISPHQPATIVANSDAILENRNMEPWEMAFFNGGAIMDEIPVSNRDIHDQVVFRDPNQSSAEDQSQKNSVSIRILLFVF